MILTPKHSPRLVVLFSVSEPCYLLQKPQNDPTLFFPSVLLVTSSESKCQYFPLVLSLQTFNLSSCCLASFLRILHSILSSELFFKKLKVLQLLISLLPLRFFTCSSRSLKRLSSTISAANSLSSVKTQQKWVLFYPLDINSFLFCSCLCNSPYLNVLQFIFFTRGKYQEINHFLFHYGILMLSTQ